MLTPGPDAGSSVENDTYTQTALWSSFSEGETDVVKQVIAQQSNSGQRRCKCSPHADVVCGLGDLAWCGEPGKAPRRKRF